MSHEKRRVLAEDNLVIDFQYALIDALRTKGVNKEQLAQMLGVSKSRISQWLSEDANPTMRTVARVFDALDYRVEITPCDLNGVASPDVATSGVSKVNAARSTMGMFDPSVFVWTRNDEARNDNFAEERERIAA